MTAILALTGEGAALARRIQAGLPGSTVYGLSGRVRDADRQIDSVAETLRALFEAGEPIVGVCAAGILIRTLAPALADKQSEPPVVAVAEDGSSVVPLLGGHRGANAVARQIAALTGGHAAVTTAGDLALGFALDEPPPGWTVANPETVKPVTAALLAGEPVRLTVEAGDGAWPPPDRFAPSGALEVRVTDRTVKGGADVLVLHPPTLAVGIGCERDAPAAEALALIDAALAEAGLARAGIAAVGSIDLKADEPAVLAAADHLGAPLRLFDAAALEAETPRLANPSDAVFREVGCHGVAEAAVLALAGPGAALVVPKRKSARATVAIARAPDRVDATRGRGRGRLAVVGVGPGAEAWRTAEAVAALRQAEAVVGYGLYLDLVGDLIAGKERHESALGAEEARARTALALAADGRDVALVCSGDPGVYALATLVFEVLAETGPAPATAGDRAGRGVEVTVVPGISAFQAAAARLGAPMGHDFCTISLSDLLTPRDAILGRIRAAAAGDFVIAFYNPQSARRRTLLGEAAAILADHRPAATPVAVARNLGREGETVTVTTLQAFDPGSVDMLSLVIVGNSETRAVDIAGRTRVFTPRGYAGKRARQKTEAST